MDGIISREEFLQILTTRTKERKEEKLKKSRARRGKTLAQGQTVKERNESLRSRDDKTQD